MMERRLQLTTYYSHGNALLTLQQLHNTHTNCIQSKMRKAINAGEMGMEEFGVVVLDEKTLEVTLERPTPYFLSLLGFVTYYPVQEAKVVEFGDKFATAAEYMVSSGPFKVETWMPEQKLNMVKKRPILGCGIG